MRLLSKTSLLIITVSIFIFLIGNILFFNVSKHMIYSYVDSELSGQMHRFINHSEESKEQVFSKWLGNDIQIKTTSSKVQTKPIFYDTISFNSIKNEYVPSRAITFTHWNKQTNYQVTITKSLLTSDSLIERITMSSILMIIVFVVSIYILNRYIFENVWSAFFVNLRKLEKYDIKSKEELNFEESEIHEFSKLNEVQLRLVERIQHDYSNLKELTANTSHEIQTPLAIIKSKAELLFQSKNLSEQDINNVDSILSTAERLSKLNQSLLLIAKIENEQFADLSSVNLKEVVEKFLQNFEIMIESGQFKLSQNCSDLFVKINASLLDIIVSNLFKNALTHGSSGGEFNVSISNNSLIVSNSGAPLNISENDIYHRFVRDTQKQNGTGLGLEIVRKICDYYNISIGYSYKNNLHIFCVDFSNISLNQQAYL